MRWWGGCNLSVIIEIPYNKSIWRVWVNVNGETHDRVEDNVTPEFKNRLNKCQLVNQKIKKKENKWWHDVDVALLERSNNKCYTSVFRDIYIYIYICIYIYKYRL